MAMEKCEELTAERAALAEQLELMEAAHAEERLKLEATSSQQTKLIDFLQCKSEGQTPKKRKVSHAKKLTSSSPVPSLSFVSVFLDPIGQFTIMRSS